MVGLGKMPIMQILADATNVIAEGEVLQLIMTLTRQNKAMQVIYSKSKIVRSCNRPCCNYYRARRKTLEALNFTECIWHCIPIVDDVLDYNADAEQLGKNIGDDLAEGKPTLPLIYAMQKAHQSKLS